MKDSTEVMRRIYGALRPLSETKDTGIWVLDSDRQRTNGSAGANGNEMQAMFEKLEGGQRRSFKPDITEFHRPPLFAGGMVIGLNFAAPPHDADKEEVNFGLLYDVYDGSYPIGPNSPILFMYAMTFVDPPLVEPGTYLVSADIVSGKVRIRKNTEDGLLEGHFSHIVARIPEVHDYLGVGPDHPYEMKIEDGRFRVHL
ncbi:hypothetical protein CSV86_019870 [Pseudomonas putida CSV86]|uniref:Uncharacterized protein n=1 Tax=Pseudomonas bharatica CSV86 TaxID=1005395 RepID=L1M2X5_9PSED|nr:MULTISPECIES: hypothetical protein [Pseudomonas]MDG9882123.1 hypothetical protein [Pseudomonas sp. GD04058]NNJ17274.1 hypothetical protein [Pseudomonas bharatica CSV86]